MANQEKTAAERYREERKKRIAKAAKQNQRNSHKIILSKKAKSAIAVLVVVAIALGIGGFAVGNSGVLQRGKVAFSVGDKEVTMAEYGYYYNTNFLNYFQYSQMYDQYGTGMGKTYTGYDWATAPDQQEYTIQEIEGVEDPMWTDYFDYAAKENIKYVKACLDYAEENNIALDDEDYAEVDATMTNIEESAKSGNYSLAAYLRAYYGKAMSVSLLRTICEEQALATKVQDTKMDEYKSKYTDAKIEKEYNDNLETYGVVSLRNYEIAAEKVKGDGEDATEAVTDETMAAAKAKAEAFAAKVNSDASFKQAAYEVEVAAENKEADKIKKDDSVTLLADQAYSSLSSTDEKFTKWAFSVDTAVGATYITEEADTGYTVYMMSEPVHHAPDTETYDVRHILVKFPEEETETETETEEASDETAEEETTEAQEEEKKEDVKINEIDWSSYEAVVDINVDTEKTEQKELYNKAQDILKEYLEGEKTAEAFGELAKKYSEDSNAETGGLYEATEKGYMVAEFEDWNFEEGRKEGDVGIVETTYGYHIMYHEGITATTWSDTIKNDLATAEYTDFTNSIIEQDNVKISGEVEESLVTVEEFVIKFVKTQIRNYQSQQSAAAY